MGRARERREAHRGIVSIASAPSPEYGDHDTPPSSHRRTMVIAASALAVVVAVAAVVQSTVFAFESRSPDRDLLADMLHQPQVAWSVEGNVEMYAVGRDRILAHGPQPGELSLLNVRDGHVVWAVSTPLPPTAAVAIDVSEDHRVVYAQARTATTTELGSSRTQEWVVRAFDLDSGEFLGEVDATTMVRGYVAADAYVLVESILPDAQTAGGGGERLVIGLHPRTLTEQWRTRVGAKVALEQGDRFLLIGAGPDMGALDTRDGQELAWVPQAMSRDEATALVARAGHVITVSEVDDHTTLRAYGDDGVPQWETGPLAGSFVDFGHGLAVLSDEATATLTQIDAATGRTTPPFEVDSGQGQWIFDVDTTMVLVMDARDDLTRYDVTTGRARWVVRVGSSGDLYDAWMGESTFVLWVGDYLDAYSLDTGQRLWSHELVNLQRPLRVGPYLMIERLVTDRAVMMLR